MTPPNSSQGGENEGSGASAGVATCSHPFGTKPASGLGASRVDQAQHTPGPYWVRTATNGKHQVCGHHGTTIREYMPDQLALAAADARRLQAGYTAGEKALRDAAPNLLEALEALVTAVTFADPPKLFNDVLCNEARVPVEFVATARAALSKARSEQGA